MEDRDRNLSEEMVRYLCNFVKTGDPNKGESVSSWSEAKVSGKKVLCMGEGSSVMRKPSLLKMVYTMLTNKAVGE